VNANTLYQALLIGWFALAGATFVLLFYVVAPYGRHTRRGWGPLIGDKAGWVLMEAPSPLVFSAWYLVGRPGTVTSLVFLAMWLVHYVYRAFIYPLWVRESERPMPLSVVGMGFAFNLVNATLNGWYLFVLSGGYPSTWLLDLRFLAGLALFAAGLLVNRQADGILRKLRKTDGPRVPGGARAYKVPEGGFYRWISCPNYFGEIVQWAGWAIATWSLPGLSFAVWTVANLAPRAWANHRWYLDNLPGYPAERKALLPRLW